MRQLVLSLTLAFLCANVASADISYGTAGFDYHQKFDTLSQSTSASTWTDKVTLAGWYSNRTTYMGSTGSNNAGSLYSFGVAGAHPVGDRALGSVASEATGDIKMGVAFVNNTGKTLNTIRIRYDGEQWRKASNADQHKLTFDYKKSNSSIGINDTGFTAIAAMNFNGPIHSTGGASPLDGNLPANRVKNINTQLQVANWAPGQTIFIRWTDINDPSTDHGLAIDNFVFSASVPEPSSVALLAGLGIIGGLITRRRMIARRKTS